MSWWVYENINNIGVGGNTDGVKRHEMKWSEDEYRQGFFCLSFVNVVFMCLLSNSVGLSIEKVLSLSSAKCCSNSNLAC